MVIARAAIMAERTLLSGLHLRRRHEPVDRELATSEHGGVAKQTGVSPRPHGSRNQRPHRSSGTDPGDVAEEGKLFERVSSEGLDKSPQG